MATLSPGFITNPNPILPDFAAIDRAVQTTQTNALAMDVTRGNLADADTERDARAAQWLLTVSGGDPAKMAEHYPAVLAERQRAGGARNAPSQFPGVETVQRWAAMGTPSATLGQQRANLAGNTALLSSLTGGSQPGASSTPGVPTEPGAPPDYSVPRGIRNNNPLNLSFANQPGATKENHPNPRFAAFATPEEGVSAAVNQLKLYQSRGNNTLRGMISTWAPPSENDTEAYVRHVAQTTGLDPDKPVNLDDPAVASKLVQAMARHENGRPLDPTIADRGVSAPVAPRGVAARTGGVDVAGPTGAVPGTPPAPGVQPPAQTGQQQTTQQQPQQTAATTQQQPSAPQPGSYTPTQIKRLAALAANPNTTEAQFISLTTKFDDDNRLAWQNAQAAQQHAQTQANAQATQAREQERLRLAQEEAETKPERVLVRYADKIADGTATHQERQLYALASHHYLKPQMQWVDDPGGDPTKKEMRTIPGQMPSGFPHPDFRPGQAEPQQPVTKTDFKPLPDKEREILIDTAKRLDQVVGQSKTFKPSYAGFANATVGEIANTAARNLPASKEAVDRAQWWSDYQRYKLAVRQGVSGQSLTESEKIEFDKADINPGMTEEVIRRNLDAQDRVLRTAHERRVGSLAYDRYNPDTIRAASGLDPAKVPARPLETPAAHQPEKKPLPPGWTVKIP
jgi:hypothetical protein